MEKKIWHLKSSFLCIRMAMTEAEMGEEKENERVDEDRGGQRATLSTF